MYMKILNILCLLLFISCSETYVHNGIKIYGKIRTKDINIPIINNIITDNYEEDPYNFVEKNDIISIASGTGVRILLLPDSNIDLLELIAENNKYKFIYYPKFKDVKNYNNDYDIGYYSDVFIENKTWISKGNDWTFSLYEKDKLIINKKIKLLEINNVLYKDYYESIFKIINVNYINKNIKYTFRYDPEKTNIIVIYKYDMNEYFYYPINIFSVKKENYEINIEWLNESEKGMYCIKTYLNKNIPKEVSEEAIFDYYYLK
jgi:hypothetical protein